MDFKKILLALIVTTLLVGSACAANINGFKVDGYSNTYDSDYDSTYLNSNGDSGVSIYKNSNGAYYEYDDGHYDYDDDGYDYDDAYDHDYDDVYDDDYVAHNGGTVYNGISDDMQLTKNADNTASFTDYDDAEHGVVEVVQLDGEKYTVIFWAKDASNINNADLISKLTDFNKDNGVSPIAF